MRIKRWYRILLVIWLFTGLPIFLLSIGLFDIITPMSILTALFNVITPQTERLDIFIYWLFGFIIIFLPVLAIPFALRMVKRD